ncbi:hypothetical protein GCM10008905_10920 [Clostridium malenominatum]|uniref:DUF4179 domain-containing protein n=1 Tax=Clostridium malenominatum TaxID=1539 RepID=A0ABN1ITG3_9CLOT
MDNNIKNEVGKINIPSSIRSKSLEGIKIAKKELENKKGKNKGMVKRKGTFVAAVIAIILITGVGGSYTALGKKIGGYFKDITNWKGAVTGIEYKDATDEIKIKGEWANIDSRNNMIKLEVELLKNDEISYKLTGAMTLGKYKIITSSGRTIKESEIIVKAEKEEKFTFEIEDSHKLLSKSKDDSKSNIYEGKLIIDYSLIKSEEYITVVIESLYSHAKGEAPLEIKGEWKVLLKL